MIKNFKSFLFATTLILIAAGAQPAYTAFWQWSKTAATNAGVDPSINWAEGMSPSSVNDSARAMMARAAEWRDDISGAITTGGTSTAYTLSTNQLAGGNGIQSPPANGLMLAFVAHASNGAAPTMQVDGGTAYPIQVAAGSPLPGGTLIIGTPYRMSFNLSQLAWVMEAGYGNPYSIPLGGILWSTISSPPNSNFAAAAGQCISNVTYAVYWVALGSPASGACAGGQFAIIDHRGRVAAGLDNLPPSGAAGRMTNSATGCGVAFTTMGVVCGNEGQTLTLSEIPNNINSTLSGSASVTSLEHQVPSNQSGSSRPNTGGPLNVADWGGGAPVLTDIHSTGSVSGSSTSNNTGGGQHTIVQPTIGLYPYLRIL